MFVKGSCILQCLLQNPQFSSGLTFTICNQSLKLLHSFKSKLHLFLVAPLGPPAAIPFLPPPRSLDASPAPAKVAARLVEAAAEGAEVGALQNLGALETWIECAE